MGSGELVDVRTLRGQIPKEVFDALVWLCEVKKFTLRDQGHKVRAYCPCPVETRGFPVPGTPSKPGNTAKRLRRWGAHCPDKHDLMGR